jgi:hypothetical protein
MSPHELHFCGNDAAANRIFNCISNGVRAGFSIHERDGCCNTPSATGSQTLQLTPLYKQKACSLYLARGPLGGTKPSNSHRVGAGLIA